MFWLKDKRFLTNVQDVQMISEFMNLQMFTSCNQPGAIIHQTEVDIHFRSLVYVGLSFAYQCINANLKHFSCQQSLAVYMLQFFVVYWCKDAFAFVIRVVLLQAHIRHEGCLSVWWLYAEARQGHRESKGQVKGHVGTVTGIISNTSCETLRPDVPV